MFLVLVLQLAVNSQVVAAEALATVAERQLQEEQAELAAVAEAVDVHLPQLADNPV
jgi:hypothetical protein